MERSEPMTNVDLLQQKVAESGLKNSFIAERLGISRAAWYKKLKGQYPFTAEQIQALCNVLHITSLREKEEIFFSNM